MFVTVEKWESAGHLEQHLTSPHVAGALAGAGDILAEAPRIVAAEPLAVGIAAKSSY